MEGDLILENDPELMKQFLQAKESFRKMQQLRGPFQCLKYFKKRNEALLLIRKAITYYMWHLEAKYPGSNMINYYFNIEMGLIRGTTLDGQIQVLETINDVRCNYKIDISLQREYYDQMQITDYQLSLVLTPNQRVQLFNSIEKSIFNRTMMNSSESSLLNISNEDSVLSNSNDDDDETTLVDSGSFYVMV